MIGIVNTVRNGSGSGMLKIKKEYKPSDGVLEYMTIIRVMEDTDKFGQLLQNMVNFMDKHLPKEVEAKGPLGI